MFTIFTLNKSYSNLKEKNVFLDAGFMHFVINGYLLYLFAL